MIYSLFSIVMAILLIGFQSCLNSPKEVAGVENHVIVGEDSILNYNKKVLEIENQNITDFINRYGWKTRTTATGLRYLIYQKGQGARPGKGSTVSINYSVSLLSGELIYRTDSLHPLTLVIGKRQVTSGLEEGILLMREGDRAKMIVPSHLAYGLLGDFDKIPSRSVLCYDVYLTSVSTRID